MSRDLYSIEKILIIGANQFPNNKTQMPNTPVLTFLKTALILEWLYSVYLFLLREKPRESRNKTLRTFKPKLRC